ncbi:acyl-CoA thioesterase II, partial [Streptomyces rhizosphaericola]
MSAALDSLLDLLDLERIERDIFRGTSRSAVVAPGVGGAGAGPPQVGPGPAGPPRPGPPTPPP